MESHDEANYQTETLTRRQSDCEAERDDTLLFYMAGRDEDLTLAEEACAEFYRRHYQFVVAFCRGRRWETEEQPAEEFVDVAFQKAWQHAERFRCPSNLSQEQVRRKVRAWLLQIAKRTFLDILRGILEADIVPLDEVLVGSEEDEYVSPSALTVEKSGREVPRVTPRRKTLVLRFLEETDRRTRAILVAVGDHWSPSSKRSEFPPEVTEALCAEFSIGKDSLRTYRRRALETLKNYIEQNEQNKDKNE